MPGNYPEESIQHSEQGKSLKLRIQLNLSQMNKQRNDMLPAECDVCHCKCKNVKEPYKLGP